MRIGITLLIICARIVRSAPSNTKPGLTLSDLKSWGHDYKLPTTQFTTLFFVIMTRSIALSLLRQGNTGTDILSILDVIVSDIEQEGINSCAEVFATSDVIEF